ncbi:DUF3137 domain-containing protein [bacterium]|nr:DUF3137 domain-containing protein [bacterium]
MPDEEKSYSQIRRDFYDKYTNKIVPLVKRHEHKRKTKLVLAILTSLALVIGGSLLLYLAYLNGGIMDKANKGLFKLAVLLYVMSVFSWSWIKKDFENSIKKKIMPTVCKCFGNMKWSEGWYSNGKIFSDSCVVPQFTSESYDDVFKGSYKDVHIEIVEPEFEIGSGRNRRTVFNGVIIKLDMNKKFSGHTVIKPNSLIHSSPSSKLHFTELEDSEFNKKFDVYTNDEVDARYLITPAFMERLKRMKTAFNASRVSCAFYEDYLIIALSTLKDIFSICSLIKPIDDRKQYIQMYDEIISIIKLIDHFKLNQKTGL